MMKLSSAFLLLCLAGSGRFNGVLAASTMTVFDQYPAVSCSISSASSVPAATSKVECALRAALENTWKSFSFENGVCVLSGSDSCSSINATSVFRKRASESSSSYPGFELSVGTRRFWVFQQRNSGLVNFSRNWMEYENGFGNSTEFWAGLALISSFTAASPRTFRTEMVALNGVLYVSEWSNFMVASASTNYTMTYGSFIGTNTSTSWCDVLGSQNGTQFSTIDRDNDMVSNNHCSRSNGGAGFWFNNCLRMNPNGLYSAVNQSSQSYMSSMCIDNYSTLRETRLMLQI